MPRYEPTPLETPAQVGDIYETLRRLQYQIGEGGGPEIVTSVTRPTTPAVGDVIYETDTSSLLTWDGYDWRQPWNLPWGRAANIKVTNATNGLTGSAFVNLPGLTVTWIATGGRRYRIDATVPIGKHLQSPWTIVGVFTGLGAQLGQASLGLQDNESGTAVISGLEYVPTASGPVEIKLMGAALAGTYDIQASAGAPAWLHVDDIGPAVIQAAPLPQGQVPGPGPGALAVIVTTPTPTSTLVAGTAVQVGAAAQAETGKTITQVEFFVDGGSIAVDISPPYQTTWTNPTAGAHALTAKATQSDAVVATSPTVNVTVTPTGGGGGPTPPPTGSNPAKLHVSGLLLKDTSNNTVTLAGVNQYIVPAFADSSNQMIPVTNWFEANLGRVADDWLAKGVNCVRIPLMYDANQAYHDRLIAAVTLLGQKGIYVILTPLDAVTFGNWPTHPGEPANDTARIAAFYLQNVWIECGKPTHLMLELWHEPVGTVLTAAEWQSGVQTADAILRTPGVGAYDGPVFITTRNWGWGFDSTEAAAIQAADSNVVFCSHRFAVSNPAAAPLPSTDPSQAWKPIVADAAAAANVALMVAMWGIYNGGYGVGGSKTANAQGWGAAMSIEIQAAVSRGQLVGALSWMWLWGAMEPGEDDQNSMVDPAWQQVTSGTAWTSNAWGQVAYAAIAAIGAGGGPPPPPPAGAPTLTFSVPSTAIAGNVVTFTATATAGTGTITNVTFTVDGVSVAVDTVAPYSATWTTTAGQHTVGVTATQSDGQIASGTAQILVSGPTGTGPLNGFQLERSGTAFIDVNGARTILRGTAQYLVEYASGGSGAGGLYSWFSSHMGVVATEWQQKGANMVRIPLHYNTTAGYINDLKMKIDALWAKGIFTMLCAFDSGSFGNILSTTAPDRLLQMYNLLGAPPYSFLETNNEPNGFTAAQWQSGMDQWRSRLRSQGYKGIIFMGARDWSWTADLSNFQSILANDVSVGGSKAGNIAFICHRYAVTDPSQPANGTADVAAWKAAWPDTIGANGIAFYINEWGPWNGGCITAGQVINGVTCTGPAYGVGGSYNNNVNVWGEGMRQAIQAAVQAGRMGGAGGWMWAWSDNNTMTGDPEEAATNYIEGTNGPPWIYNAWGLKMWSLVSTIAGAPPTAGNPTVTHSAPSAATTASSVTVTANATPGGAGTTITNTNLLIDGVSVAGDTVAPYSLVWTNATAGTHTVAVRATQSDGKQATSTPTNIVVSDPSGGGPPTVTHSAPSSAVTGAAVTITAVATPASGTTITTTTLIVDGAATAVTDSTSPYSLSWTALAGTHSIAVRATQSDAQTATSLASSITVTSAPPPSGGAGTLHVSGRLLKDASNNTVFLKGVNQYIVTPYYDAPNNTNTVGGLFTWFDSNIGRVADDWAAQGVRAVAMPILISDLSTSYKDWVKRIVTACISRGMYILPRCFEAFNDPYTTGAATQRANVLLTHWNWCGRPAMMMLNLWNEPNNGGSGQGSLFEATWRASSEAARATFRTGGYTAPIFYDAAQWATVNDTVGFNQLLTNDSSFGGNLVFTQHRYHALCGNGYLPTNWATSTQNGNWNTNGVCWVYGEYGWHNCYNDPTNAPAFITDITTAIINAKNANQCAGAWAWMWTWADENELIIPQYWQIMQGQPWNYSKFSAQQWLRMLQNT